MIPDVYARHEESNMLGHGEMYSSSIYTLDEADGKFSHHQKKLILVSVQSSGDSPQMTKPRQLRWDTDMSLSLSSGTHRG